MYQYFGQLMRDLNHLPTRGAKKDQCCLLMRGTKKDHWRLPTRGTKKDQWTFDT